MEIFNSSIDLVRIVFLLGAVLALVYKKKLGVTPGGIIVPGVLAGILFTSFLAFLISLATTMLCWLVYKFFIARYALSNRWTSLACISLSVLLGLVGMFSIERYGLLDQATLLLTLVAPGLITISSKKYGFGKTLSATMVVTAATAMLGLILAHFIPYQLLTSLSVQLAVYTPLALTYPFVVLPVSLIAAILAYYRFGLRGGGYLVAPFLAVVLISSPIQALLILLGVIVSYGAVNLIQKYTLAIGLERFVLSLFCGYFAVTAIDLLATLIHIEGYRPSPLILIIAIAVLTNDLCLQPIRASLKKSIGPSFLVSFVTRLAV